MQVLFFFVFWQQGHLCVKFKWRDLGAAVPLKMPVSDQADMFTKCSSLAQNGTHFYE